MRQLTQRLVIARIVALSTQARAYFPQVELNAAIGFQALHLTQPRHMLQAANTTVRRAWTIHGHRPTSLPAAVRAALPPYYGDNTDQQRVHSSHGGPPTPSHAQSRTGDERSPHAETARGPVPSHHLPPIHTSPAGPSHQGGDPRMEPRTTPATPTPTCHPNKPLVQGDRSCGGPTHRCG